MEAIVACAKPCVAFNIGGTSDMIEHEEINGYLAQHFKIVRKTNFVKFVNTNQ